MIVLVFGMQMSGIAAATMYFGWFFSLKQIYLIVSWLSLFMLFF